MQTLKALLEYTLLEIGEYRLSVIDVISIIFIFLFARLVLWLLHRLLNKSLAHRISDKGRQAAIMQIARYLVYIMAILAAFNTVGISITWLLTGSAALLVGLGLGLQNTFKDFISGVIILFDASLEVGDVVQVGELVGRVQQIGLRTTAIDTRDAISVLVPNSKFTDDNVINWSHNNELTRFQVSVGVAYGSDVDLVMKLLEEAAASHPKVSSTPPPVARFVDFGDSALLFEVLFWTTDSFRVEFTRSDIRRAIDAAFRKHHVQIPFPQRDLHIVSDFRARLQEQAENKPDLPLN
ncbi:MAG: mechanosensitive ion channel protein MscS [Bacteroidetes bacterium]|nr:MAG: mechanosensitive ion channel protein MscS [Bacteroidota bacterium]